MKGSCQTQFLFIVYYEFLEVFIRNLASEVSLSASNFSCVHQSIKLQTKDFN